MNIGVIGDFDPECQSHQATSDALYHASVCLSSEIDIRWVPTSSLEEPGYENRLSQFDGLFAAPGSPYTSLDGALKGIQFAREMNRPFIGTWGGFQHALLEYARNVAGLKEAGHLEYDPSATTPLITLASCPVDVRPDGAPLLWGRLKIKVSPDSLAHRIYKKLEVEEAFQCNYELNPEFRGKLEGAGLKVTGIGENDEARIIEITTHRFFVATNFQPQLISQLEHPHPLIVAYLEETLGPK